MPQKVGSKEDLISKNIQSRHIEFCKAGRTHMKINSARHQHDTERTQNIAGFQP